MINNKLAIKKHKKYNPFDENHMPSFEVTPDNLNIQTSREMINHKSAIKKHRKYNPFDENHMPSFRVTPDNLNIQNSRDNDKS